MKPYQNIGIGKVVLPVGSNLPLAANVPYVQFKAIRCYGFNIESGRRSYLRNSGKHIGKAKSYLLNYTYGCNIFGCQLL